jgi:putative membrane protein
MLRSLVGSVVHIGAQTSRLWLATAGVVGLALGLGASLLADGGGAQAGAALPLVFGAGALAATAWILPGVSGAFVLLLLGLYKPLLEALRDLDLAVVAAFAAGLALGLFAFAKMLRWLLARARLPVLALLTGFMAGSLVELWPWRIAAAVEPALAGVLAAMVAGAIAIAALAWASRRVR